VIDDATPAADAALAAKTTFAKCAQCGHEDALPPGGGSQFEGVIVCDECKTRIAFGVAQPRVVIEPGVTPNFIALRLSGVAIRDKRGNVVELEDILLDHAYAEDLAVTLRSIVRRR
jgi:hypothetical protein